MRTRGKGVACLLIFLMLASPFARAGFISVKDGNWEDPETWKEGQVPVCGQEVVIASGHKVTVTTILNYSTCSASMNMNVNIDGELRFRTGKKLRLPCNSVVAVRTGGRIISGVGRGSSNIIEICGTVVWRSGDGNVTEPIVFSVGGGGLPVELVYFHAEAAGKDVQLKWQTASELNNSFFTIEKSLDGHDFFDLGKVPCLAINGNSSSFLDYSFKDEAPAEGVNYYRLKQTDKDGSFEYSSPVAVQFNGAERMSFTLYPNPTRGEFVIAFAKPERQQEVLLVVFDPQGKKVYEAAFTLETSRENKIEIIPEEPFCPGFYLCSVIMGGKKQEIRIVVN